MKKVCIYHSRDLDGWMSAAIVNYEFNNAPRISNSTIDFIGFDYGNPIPDLSSYHEIIMCDISFPKEEMEKISNRAIWIDHHISKINEIDFEIDGLRDPNFAACELTWEYFFPHTRMPEIVRLLGRYDCFGHKGTEEEQKVLEFQYGARGRMVSYEDCNFYLDKNINLGDIVIDEILNEGKTIYKYLCTEAKQIFDTGFPIVLEGYKFVFISRERFNPINFNIDYHGEGYDGVICFWLMNNGKFQISIYNDNGEVDCSQIAKSFGGGGHKGASGAILSKEEFINLLEE